MSRTGFGQNLGIWKLEEISNGDDRDDSYSEMALDLNQNSDDDENNPATDIKSGTYPLGVYKSYVHTWKQTDAFRELYQNWKDALVVSFDLDPRNFNKRAGTVELANFNSRLEMSHLSLGGTTMRGVEDNRCAGTHGEGFKLAALVMHRNNHARSSIPMYHTIHGNLILDKSFKTHVYLKGLRLGNGSQDGKKYAFSYNFSKGEVNRGRERLISPKEEGKMVAKIWEEATHDDDILQHYMPLFDQESSPPADIAFAETFASKVTARRIWRNMQQSSLKAFFFYSPKDDSNGPIDGRSQRKIILSDLEKKPKKVPRVLWKILRKHSLVRTPEEEVVTLFSSLLRATLELHSAPSRIIVVPVKAQGTGINLFYRDSPPMLLVHEKCFDFDTAHEEGIFSLSSLARDKLDDISEFLCGHVVEDLFDLAISHLLEPLQLDHAEVASLRKQARSCIRQTPQGVQVAKTGNAGELSASWTMNEDRTLPKKLRARQSAKSYYMMGDVDDVPNPCGCQHQAVPQKTYKVRDAKSWRIWHKEELPQIASSIFRTTASSQNGQEQRPCVSTRRLTDSTLFCPQLTFTFERDTYVQIRMRSREGIREHWLVAMIYQVHSGTEGCPVQAPHITATIYSFMNSKSLLGHADREMEEDELGRLSREVILHFSDFEAMGTRYDAQAIRTEDIAEARTVANTFEVVRRRRSPGYDDVDAHRGWREHDHTASFDFDKERSFTWRVRNPQCEVFDGSQEQIAHDIAEGGLYQPTSVERIWKPRGSYPLVTLAAGESEDFRLNPSKNIIMPSVEKFLRPLEITNQLRGDFTVLQMPASLLHAATADRLFESILYCQEQKTIGRLAFQNPRIPPEDGRGRFVCSLSDVDFGCDDDMSRMEVNNDDEKHKNIYNHATGTPGSRYGKPVDMNSHAVVPLSPVRGDKLTVRELARLQGFKDDFIFYGNVDKHQYPEVLGPQPPAVSKAIVEIIRLVTSLSKNIQAVDGGGPLNGGGRASKRPRLEEEE
ncbi:hypothetical protein B0H63DRAFT_449511 [Podospora didyma]|uniref:S-adenosyl-L-methionine-dependent methyltransferase n=1 Tax=Podospora didyma TaxID=330526 RepID=A0AAE0TZV4_9PEZI|nr:hypothetical protein B0H63DRAFT_449511 [Podospora didyma]